MVDNTLAEIFSTVFEVSTDEARLIRRATKPDWDSLAHVTLITAIQSEFSIELGSIDYERMTSFSTTKALLKDKGL